MHWRENGVRVMGNHSFDIYKKISTLLSEGIHLSDILHYMDIKQIYVYGAGGMGRLALTDLSGKMEVLAVFDRNLKNEDSISICKKGSVFKYSLYKPDKIPKDKIPILITPATMYSEIVNSLKDNGISDDRFLSLNLLLYYGMYYLTESREAGENLGHCFSRRQFLITGAQFSNKGSQAMLFTAMSEIRKRYKNALIWFCPNFWDKEYEEAASRYRLIFILDGKDETSTLYELMPHLDGIIDVSGYALASHGSVNETDREMNYFRLAKRFQVPIYLMPQSFGPFDYEAEKKEELEKLLSYVNVIFAREKSGYDLLIDHFHLSNVKRSYDLVLQNKEVRLKDIYFCAERKRKLNLPTRDNVAVIPNLQNYKYGNPEEVLYIYIEIVNTLVSLKKEIYIVSHSEDESICKDIYKSYRENPRVHLFEEKFDCLEFCQLVENFKYIIASRFHAVVHSYKMHVPCIVIGWTEKYRELLELFGQEEFLFDVSFGIDVEKIYSALKNMDISFAEESEKIRAILPRIQSKNCFDIFNFEREQIQESNRL